MPRMFRTLLVASVLLLAAAPAWAQSGKVTGTVRDASGETLPGVNVRFEGTTQGASTDIDGRYTIIGVRPGEYTLVFSFIGFQTRRVEGVRVRIDLTTTVDATLEDDAVEGAEVVVQADRALFQRDVTATTATVSGDEIRAIPVENFSDVVALQAGVVNSGGETHFRGGRGGEVGYWIDGVPVTDVYNGGLALSIENESVQELQVVTGAFNAEYGQALSGIVNVVTRDGSNDFSGEVEVWSGDYLGREGASAAGIEQNAPGSSLRLFPGVGAGDFQPLAVRNVEGSFSGPILRNRLFFFGSTRYFANDGYIQGQRRFGLDDVGFDELGRLSRLPQLDGDGNPLPADSTFETVGMDPYEKLSGQFKLSAQLPFGIRLSGNLLASTEQYRDKGFDLLFLPDARRQNERLARTGILKLTHLLSSTTFYEIGVTNNFTRFQNFLFEDPLDERYRDPQFLGFRDPQFFSGFALGGTDNGRFRRVTNTWLAKADVSSQIHPAHLVKTGIEVRRHSLSLLDQFSFRSEVPGQEQPLQLFTTGDYNYSPTEFAAYIQDKVEIGGLIINAGLRFDYFNSNGVVFRDPTDPATVFPNLRQCLNVVNLQCQPDANGNVYRENPYTPDELFEPASGTYQISPRLGVAFPITDGGVVHFSYGQFFQTPNFELLYQNPYFLLSSAGSGLVGLLGNANLKPEQTINGEIGIKQELTGSSAVEVTAFYRDIRNLAGTATAPIVIEGTSARYGQLVNSDFGFVRGVILRYDQRVGRALYAGVDYTFQVARANASDPDQVYSAAAAQQQLETQIIPTNWDQRHTINGSLTYTNDRLDAGFGLLASYGSGTPYTPARTSRVTGGTVPPSVIPINSEIRPSSLNVNLTAYRNFSLPGGTRFQLWTKVDNVFDSRNETNIFGDTGRATYSLEQSIEGANFLGDPAVLAQRYVRPDFFSQPRRVVLGLRFNF